jgi:7-cyano-7-deazaguanine synthase
VPAARSAGLSHSRTTVSVRSKSFDLTHDVTDLPSIGGLLGGSALTDPRGPVPDRHCAAESMRATVVPNRSAVMLDIAVSTDSARGPEMTGKNWHVSEKRDTRPTWSTREKTQTVSRGTR